MCYFCPNPIDMRVIFFKLWLLLFLLSLPCLPTQANTCVPPPIKKEFSVRFQNHWFAQWIVKRVEKRRARLECKLAKAQTPQEVARIKKKQEITTFKVVVFFIAILAGLLGLVGLLFKAENFAMVCFLIMLVGLVFLFPGLFGSRG